MGWLTSNLGTLLPILGAVAVVLYVIGSGKKSTDDQTTPATTSNLTGLPGKVQADLAKAKAVIESLAKQLTARVQGAGSDPIQNAVQLLTVVHAALAQQNTPEAQAALAELEKMAGPLLLPLIKAQSTP